MKRRFIPLILSVAVAVGAVVVLGLSLPGPSQAAQASPEPPVTPPMVAVYLKNITQEYDVATTQFLHAQFGAPASPASGLISYTVVTTVTQQALAGKAALIIDESADVSLTASEVVLIRDYVAKGGRIGLFTFPRHYWDHEGANPGAYEGLAGIFGDAKIGEPEAGELASGQTSAVAQDVSTLLDLDGPYTVTGQTVANVDQVPFLPISSTGTVPLLVSPAAGNKPVAVANSHGVLVTNSIGDLVQGSESSATYSQFVSNAMVWLASGSPVASLRFYMPVMSQLSH